MRALLALLAASSPVQDAASLPSIDIDASGVQRGPNACAIKLVASNNTRWAVRISAEAYLVTPDKTTLSETSVLFPTAVPGGKALATASFMNLPGACPEVHSITVAVDRCRMIPDLPGYTIKDCKVTRTFNIKSPKLPGER